MLQRSGQHVFNLDETTRIVNVDLEAKYFGRIKSEFKITIKILMNTILYTSENIRHMCKDPSRYSVKDKN